MKIFIWIGCFFVATLINNLIGHIVNLKFGYLAIYLFVFFISKKLCEKWENRSNPKSHQHTYSDNIFEDKEECNIENKIIIEKFCPKCGAEISNDILECHICGEIINN